MRGSGGGKRGEREEVVRSRWGFSAEAFTITGYHLCLTDPVLLFPILPQFPLSVLFLK